MKKLALLLCLCILLILCSCTGVKKFTAYEYDAFDTITTFTAICGSQAEFDKYSSMAFKALCRYDTLFDIYSHHDGVVNLYDVNASKGKETVVPNEIIELLEYSVNAYSTTNGKVNVAMGAVLRLWHDARNTKVLPDKDMLNNASKHCSIEDIAINKESCTVKLLDSEMSIDVGAVAKGWACEKIAELLTNAGCENFVLSAGGNVVTRGSNNGKPWQVGIQDPENSGILTVLEMKNGSVVTSGGYNRFAEIDGKMYHHIIDSETLMPAEYIKSVTVICTDSAMADVLSTAFFQMSADDILKQAEALNVDVIIVKNDGTVTNTSGIISKK